MPYRRSDGIKTITLCFLIALCCHLLIFSALRYWNPNEDFMERTVPIVLVSSPSQVASVQSASSSTSPTKKEVVSTTSSSENRISTSKEVRKPPTRTLSRAENSSPITLPSRTQNTRQNQSNASLKELFSSAKTNASPARKQISTKNTPVLSPYQITLRQHMLKGDLYDNFHQYFRSHQEKQIDYTLQLTLLANGALKGATMVSSSGTPELDKLAITAAYNASPYPKPPKQDASNGFRYQLPFTYLPGASN